MKFKTEFNKPFVLLLIISLLFSYCLIFTACSEDKISKESITEQTVQPPPAESSAEETTKPEETAPATEPALINYYTSDLSNSANYTFICPDKWLLFESGKGSSVIISNTGLQGSESESIFIFVENEVSAKGLSDEKSILDSYLNAAADDTSAEFLDNEKISIGSEAAVLAGYSYSSKLEKDYQDDAQNIDLFTYMQNDDSLYCIKYVGLNIDRKKAKDTFTDFLAGFSVGQENEKIKEKDENSKINILIMGDDSGLGRPGGRVSGRTDIIILLHINLDTAKGTAVTIPRDTWVAIPGHSEGKINGAHAIGGNELAVKTVEDFSGLEIDNYIITDFDGFIPLIDFLGGVTVEVGEDLADGFSGCYLSKGVHHLNGEQALALSRNRHRSGDGSTQSGAFAREREAAKIIVGLMDQKSTFERIVAMPVFINYLLNYTWTDLRFKDIIKLLPLLGRIKAGDIEITGVPSWPATIGKASAVDYDRESTAELFEEVDSQ
ncbi:MAG: LCP family protein [Actinobacteria bacterium]|nr:LCP family protein [Actinomycetota bacterium]